MQPPDYRRALELNAAQPDANLGLGMILLQQGDRGGAMRKCNDKVLSGEPRPQASVVGRIILTMAFARC